MTQVSLVSPAGSEAAVPRSYLFVPGSSPELFVKADRGAADAVVLDLEDGVALGRKADARQRIAEWVGAGGGRKPVWVRVHSDDRLAEDLEALAPVTDGLAGLIVAKANAVALREAAGSELPLAPMIETATSLLELPRLACLPSVVSLHLGEVDLAADAGLSPGEDEAELAWPRAQLVFASRAAGLVPPPAPVSTLIADREGFRRSTERAARQGFAGRVCIHPAQVAIAHEVFTPAPDEVAQARELLAGFESSLAAGEAVFTAPDGRMVDEAVLRAARRTLALAREEPG